MVLEFQGEVHMDENLLISIFDLHSHPNMGSERTHERLKKRSQFAKKVLLKLNFERKGDLYANDFFYFLDICCKRRLFQFLPCGIRMHIAILTGVQIGHPTD